MCVLQRSPHHTPFRLRKVKRSDNTKCSQRRGVLLNPLYPQQKHLASLCKAAHMCPSQPALLLLETETQTQTSLSTETLLRTATIWKPSTRMFSQQQPRQMDYGSQDHNLGADRFQTSERFSCTKTMCTSDHVSYTIPSVVWGSTPQSDMISSVKRMRPHTKWNRSY